MWSVVLARLQNLCSAVTQQKHSYAQKRLQTTAFKRNNTRTIISVCIFLLEVQRSFCSSLNSGALFLDLHIQKDALQVLLYQFCVTENPLTIRLELICAGIVNSEAYMQVMGNIFTLGTDNDTNIQIDFTWSSRRFGELRENRTTLTSLRCLYYCILGIRTFVA